MVWRRQSPSVLGSYPNEGHTTMGPAPVRLTQRNLQRQRPQT